MAVSEDFNDGVKLSCWQICRGLYYMSPHEFGQKACMSDYWDHVNEGSRHDGKGEKLQRKRHLGIQNEYEGVVHLSCCYVLRRITGQLRETNRTLSRDADAAKAHRHKTAAWYLCLALI